MLRNTFTQIRPLGLVLLAYGLIAALGLPATAATASELLEKAIYTEESVGDLDKAIQTYEKVVVEGKDAQNVAAQAQFRIGTCYAKLGKTEESAKAFQAVIDNYPQAIDWIARAKSQLPGSPELLPVPWGDGDELIFEMKLANGMSVGHQVFRVGKVEKEGRTMWECNAWQSVVLNNMAGKSRVLADYKTFAPIESQWKHSLLGNSKATFGKDQVTINMVGKDKPITLKYEGPAYDNEQGAELFRRLPLKAGYKTEINIIPILTATQLPLGLHVSKLETLDVPAGKFECFRLELNIGQTFWISNDSHRYIVRFEGGGVIADLTEVRKSKPNQSTPLKGERFKAILPSDWYAYTPSKSEKKIRSKTWLIDPAAALSSRVEASPLELIKEKHGSPHAWLKAALKGDSKRTKDFSLHDKGIEMVTIGNREAAVATFTFLDGDKSKTGQEIALFGDSSAINLRFLGSSDEFEKWQPEIEKILATLEIE